MKVLVDDQFKLGNSISYCVALHFFNEKTLESKHFNCLNTKLSSYSSFHNYHHFNPLFVICSDMECDMHILANVGV